MANKSGIHIKASHVGKLHEALRVPDYSKIPASKMEAAKQGASPTLKKQIVFAENARKWNKK